MNACLLDVFHDAAYQHRLAVCDCIHIHFNGIIQKVIEQNRGVMRNLDCLAHITFQVYLLVDNFHGSAAQYIAGAHD